MDTPGVIFAPTDAETETIWANVTAVLPWLVQPGGARLRVMEVAGDGFFTERVAAAGHVALLLNANAETIDVVRDRLVALGSAIVGTVALVRAPIADLGKRWPPESFDLILCHQVFDRSFDPKLVFDALAGAVRPGGHLSLAFQDRASAPAEALRTGDREGAQALLDGAIIPAPGLLPDDVTSWLADAHFEVLLHTGVGANGVSPTSDAANMLAAAGLHDVARLRHIVARRPAVFPIPL